jgi:catechol 2,3-dioxygenase-like lactoylglutathione lyase family enzyme
MFGLPFHHIGIACRDIERTAEFVKHCYVIKNDTGTIFDELQNAHLRLFNAGEPVAIELITGDPVAKVNAHNGTYYHVCYQTHDLEATLKQAIARGAIPVSSPKPAVLFNMRRVAFIYTPIGLVEFLEK